jgi:hypothetical protein
MDSEDQIEEARVLELAAAPYKNLDQWSAAGTGMSQAQADWNAKQESARAAQYEAMRKALNERRFRPSRAEQLFALSAAIGKPHDPPQLRRRHEQRHLDLAGIEKANREAQTSRAEALAALEQSLLNQTDAAKQAEFRRAARGVAAQGPVLARIANANAPKFDVVGDRFMERPGTGNNLGILTPDQLLLAKQDPRNKGKTFYTQDGRTGVIN